MELDTDRPTYDALLRQYRGSQSALRAAIAELNEARAENERLRAALEAMEWVEMPLVVMPDPSSICPWCGGTYGNGHSPDCLRQRALKGGE